MKSLVVYDSTYGNTKKIAEAISSELDNCKLVFASDFEDKDLEGIDLLVVGSPIIGWKPSEGMIEFLDNLEDSELKNIQATSFDTRVNLFIHGDACKKISKRLEKVGATIIINPVGFIVKGSEGPLFDGEIEKATEWGKEIKKRVSVK